MRNPQVTVNFKETVSWVVTVEGWVRKLGLYSVVGRMTLMRVIARAKGTDEAIRHGASPDTDIYAKDGVMAGDPRSRWIFKNVLAIIPASVTPVIIGSGHIVN